MGLTRIKSLDNVTAISAGTKHSLALKDDGTVWAWGNARTIFGKGENENSIAVPSQIEGLSNVIDISAGRKHSIVIKQDGTVWAWGRGDLLGHENASDSYIPVQVKIHNAKAISAGIIHSMALLEDGSVWTWGSNMYGQLGNKKAGLECMSPIQVNDVRNVTAISAGGDQCIALDENSIVYKWGTLWRDEIGDYIY